MKQWLVRMWLDSSCEECFCSTQDEALEFARALMNDYQERLSWLSITNPDRTFEVVFNRGAHLNTAEASPIVGRSGLSRNSPEALSVQQAFRPSPGAHG